MFIKALVQCVTSERTGHLPDMGIAKLIIFGILLRQTLPLRSYAPLLRFGLIAMFLIFPVPRINTNSALTGVCLLLPCLLLFNEYFKSEDNRLAKAFQIALLLAGAATMRPTFLCVLLLASGLFAIWSLIMLRHWKTPYNFLKLHSLPWIISLGLLIPWMILSWISCRTPFWPFMTGNANPLFNQVGSKDGFWMDLFNALAFQTRPDVFVLLIPLLVSFFIKRNAFTVCVTAGTIIATIYIAIKAGVALPVDVVRFMFPIAFTGLLYVFCRLSAFHEKPETKQAEISGNIVHPEMRFLSLCVLAMSIIYLSPSLNLLTESVSSLYSQIAKPGPILPLTYTEDYSKLQALVPPHEKILSAVDAPYLLDYKRNTIYSIDIIGGASPSPGMPQFKGPIALKTYLKELGIYYIIAVDWDKGLLHLARKTWRDYIRPEWFWKEIYGPHALNFMDNVDSLERSQEIVAKTPNCRLIKILK